MSVIPLSCSRSSAKIAPVAKKSPKEELEAQVLELMPNSGRVSSIVISYMGNASFVVPDSLVERILIDPGKVLRTRGMDPYGLGECDCDKLCRNQPSHFRTQGRVRETLRDAVVDKALNSFNDRELTVLSVGAGDGFTEAELMTHLVVKGNFTNLRLIALNKRYAASSAVPGHIEAFYSAEVAPQLGGKLTVVAKSSLDDYLAEVQKKSEPLPDIVLMIDLDDDDEELTDKVVPLLFKAAKAANTPVVFGYTLGSSAVCMSSQMDPRTLRVFWQLRKNVKNSDKPTIFLPIDRDCLAKKVIS